jgi:hypothetical protein
MSFRAKVRKVLKGSSSSSKAKSDDNPTPPQRTDIEYYKPGEIPRSKYRDPWNQKHQDKLHAFSFEDASRDPQPSMEPAPPQSPWGTVAHSRRSSWVSRARSSLGGGRSDAEEDDDDDGAVARRKSHNKKKNNRGFVRHQVVETADEEEDVRNGK